MGLSSSMLISYLQPLIPLHDNIKIVFHRHSKITSTYLLLEKSWKEFLWEAYFLLSGTYLLEFVSAFDCNFLVLILFLLKHVMLCGGVPLGSVQTHVEHLFHGWKCSDACGASVPWCAPGAYSVERERKCSKETSFGVVRVGVQEVWVMRFNSKFQSCTRQFIPTYWRTGLPPLHVRRTPQDHVNHACIHELFSTVLCFPVATSCREELCYFSISTPACPV